MGRRFLVKVNKSGVGTLQHWATVQTSNEGTGVVQAKSVMRTARTTSPRNCLHNISLGDVAECPRNAKVPVQGILENSQSTAAAEAGCLMGHSSVKAA